MVEGSWAVVETRDNEVHSVHVVGSFEKAIDDAADVAEMAGQNRREALRDLKRSKYTEEGEVRLSVVECT